MGSRSHASCVDYGPGSADISLRAGSLALRIGEWPGPEGATPAHLLAAAVAASTSRRVRACADRCGIQLDRIEVDVTHETEGGENVFTRLLILEGSASAEERETLIGAARECPVARMLEQGSLVISLYGGWIDAAAA